MPSKRIAIAAGVWLAMASANHASDRGSRQVVNFNAGWQFVKGSRDAAKGAPDSAWQAVDLPHTWNREDGQDGGNDYYRGPGCYRRTLPITEAMHGKRVFLRFGAANTVADVYVNDQHVGQHRGGFSAFCFEVTERLAHDRDNTLEVQVDNSHFDDVPPWSADFTFFGGIYRDVVMLVTDPVCISPLDYASPGVYFKQTKLTEQQADVDVTVLVSNGDDKARDIEISITVQDAAGTTVSQTKTTASVLARSDKRVEQSLSIKWPRLWNGRVNPHLYDVTVNVFTDGNLVDSITQSLGLREFRVDPERGLLLNGKPHDLHGVNRHQDWLDMGWAISRAEHERDLELILELGCTGVRLAHYQHDDYFYELCDRAGLIVWAEIPLVNRVADTPAFRDNSRQQLIELIRQNYNHPSIFFWGIHNEVTAPWEPGPDPTDLVRELAELAKTEDPTRLTVSAATIPDDHPANWQTDAVAFNRYYGWYHDEPDGFAAWADRRHSRTGPHGEHPDKPIGVSEYGAGASIRHHQFPPQKPEHAGRFHPEEWQAHVHERHWLAMKQRPYLWCKFVWNMFDFASDGRSEGDTLGRNDKGLVTYDRMTKKDAFYMYKAHWSKEPFVHIAGRRHVERTDDKVTIRVYSNCEQVTLTVNDQPLGTKTRSADVKFEWPDVALSPGTNWIRAESGVGAARVVDECQWFLSPKP